MNSDTPRTEEVRSKTFDDALGLEHEADSAWSFARQLERELNEANATLAAKGMSAIPQGSVTALKNERDKLRARVADLEALTDRLRQDLNDPPADVQELVIKKLNLVSSERVKELEADKARLEIGLKSVQALIDDSYGVSGLHLNGSVAPWDTLRTGGAYEEWLIDFDAAMEGNQ